MADIEMKPDSVEPKNGATAPASEEPLVTSEKPPVSEEVAAVASEVSERIERSEFSSDAFKIELSGLPRFFGVGGAKKLFKTHDLTIKPCGKNATYMFVNFANEEDREKAVATLDGVNIKGRKIKAFNAKAPKDPLLRHREERNTKPQGQPQEEDTRTVKERLFAAVCSLADKPYPEQLTTKRGEVIKLMANLRRDVLKQVGFLKGRKGAEGLLEDDNIATVGQFVESPVVDGYRNKCEFSVGLHPETQAVTVGFRLASYKKGSVSVVGVEDMPIVSDRMKRIALHFESFVRSSGLDPFNNVSQSGHWKQLTVRTARTGDALVWAILHPQDMNDADKDSLRAKLKSHFCPEGAGKDVAVNSLHIQFFARREKGKPEPPVENLSGHPHITEHLYEGSERLTFHVSPQAFFQVNSAAAEVLYRTAGDAAGLSKKSTLLDVCCGTGTIGLSLASRVDRVLGVDIVAEAIENADKNAKRNGIENAEFHAGRAENILSDLTKQAGPNACAIVDPPRAGLHPRALMALRASSVKTLVFVACDARAAMNNFVGLARPTSNAFPGDPFVPRQVIPVDLFPHTPHFELIVVFERIPMKKILNMDTALTAKMEEGKKNVEETLPEGGKKEEEAAADKME